MAKNAARLKEIKGAISSLQSGMKVRKKRIDTLRQEQVADRERVTKLKEERQSINSQGGK